MERRELFGSLFSKKKKENEEIVVRPPYFLDKDSFYKECISCEETPCVTFCEENIIVMDKDKTPKIDFKLGGCTFCDECAKACPSEVLSLEHRKNIDVKVEIDIMKCVSWHNTMCFSCKDPCLDDAINFLAMFRPSIDTQKCTSCGFCMGYCPTDAIIIKN
jgi:ferredoxin-type protein NapF